MIVLEILRNIFLVPLELIFEVIFTLAYKITNSEGIAIIVLSLVVSTLVLPLYKRAESIEQKENAKQKELSRWVEHIKKNFKGDERYMMLDAYYRENHYSPIYQLRSTISILLQIPFFIAAYDLLGVRAIDRFSGTGGGIFSFDLGAPDGLISCAGITINILPILMTLVSVLTTYIYTKELPPKMKIRSLVLPVLFLIVLYNSPSALLVYWTMNNFYSLIKILILNKSDHSASAEHNSKTTTLHKAGIMDMFLTRETNVGLFILASVFLAVLTGLLIPLAYLSASPEEFISITDPKNPLIYLLSSFFVSVGFFVLWPSIFYYLANKKVKNVLSALMFGVSVYSIVDYLFFGTNLGTINTTLVFDNRPNHSLSQMIINLILVIAILAACFFLYKYKKVQRVVFLSAIMALITISFISAKKVQDTYTSVMKNIAVYREEIAPQITLSANGENVMIIMLDRGVSGYIPYAFHEFPELEEKFDGFVYYPNTISFGQHTLQASAPMLGGYEYTPERMDARADETLAEKHDEAYRVLPVLFSNKGYDITYMDLPFVGWSWNGDYSALADIDNFTYFYVKDYYSNNTETHMNIENRRNRNMFMYSIFKCSPLCVQEFIYDEGNYLSVAKDAYNVYDLIENYKVLENLDDMTQISSDSSGLFVFIDNETTHDTCCLNNYDPYSPRLTDEDYYISDGQNELHLWHSYQQATYECLVAALLELGDYLDYLKEIGVYDNTRIIIVSDHGTLQLVFDELISDDFSAEWYNCLLMVKDFDSTGFSTDYTFMTNADVPTIALMDIIEDPVNPATGLPINSDLKYDKIYVGYSMEDSDERLWNPEYNMGYSFYVDDNCSWYELLNGNIFDTDNWVLTDKPQ